MHPSVRDNFGKSGGLMAGLGSREWFSNCVAGNPHPFDFQQKFTDTLLCPPTGRAALDCGPHFSFIRTPISVSQGPLLPLAPQSIYLPILPPAQHPHPLRSLSCLCAAPSPQPLPAPLGSPRRKVRARGSLGFRESRARRGCNQSILKEINPTCSLERLMLKLQSFGHLM